MADNASAVSPAATAAEHGGSAAGVVSEPDWRMYFDDVRGVPFWFNSRNGVSQWCDAEEVERLVARGLFSRLPRIPQADDTRHTADQSAAAEHATSYMSDAGLDAISNFFSLGLQHYAVNLTLEDREYHSATAFVALATKPGDGISIGQGTGDLLAKWWGFVAFESPKRTDNSKSPVMWKESKNLDNFISWVRLCQRHREEVAKKRSAASAAEQGVSAASAAKQGVPGSLPSWLGGLELSEDENKQCFQLTMKHILEKELTPAQRRNPAYHWTLGSEKGPSNKARSLHDAIVRKHLGHKNTAHHIYQHGFSRLLCDVDTSCRRHSATAAEHRGQTALVEATDVQTALAEAADWMLALTSTLFGRQEDLHTPVMHMLSARLQDLSPEQCEERRSRISSIRKFADQVAKAKKLASDRDSGKRKWEDLSRDDMQLLEDFDVGRLHKRRKEILAPRGSAFRSQLSSASAAAEHAAASASVTIKEEIKEE